MKIFIQSAEVIEKTGVSQKTGKPYSIREQLGYAHIPGKHFPVAIRIPLEDGSAPYPEGNYLLSDRSFQVGSFDTLKLGRVYLESTK